ncbi:sickle tail protein homolog isoform X3 [Callorhinchus milii]|uniref:sickle tail protein homolog isoform X3 n=1 Tax=Callorhinchus milii TaxID=7868 RepID=UPI001C3F9195|nr:sickle tail protein homolog isoform X3 [Callorhinchus milii]
MRGSEETSVQSPKHTNSDSRSSEFEIPTSPPLNYQELHTPPAKTWQPHPSGTGAHLAHSSPAHASRSPNLAGMGQAQASRGDETAMASNKRSADRVISVEAAERDWEEKRASLTQFSNKDINRLLEETQAELMKAIPDLGFGNKPKPPGVSVTEQKPAKPQHVQKTTATKIETNGRRHSEELTVHKYRTEKPSKSPPPPPPRRSFPSVHGLTTGRSGEVIITNKKEASLKKAESDDTETQRPHVKLRRTVSDVKPPSTPPPIVASAVRDDEDEEERIMAELEEIETPVSPGSAQLPAVVLSPRSSWTSVSSSPEPPDVEEHQPGATGDSDAQGDDGASEVCEVPAIELDSLTAWSQQEESSAETTGLFVPCEGQPEGLELSYDPLSSSEHVLIVEQESSRAKPAQPCDDGEPASSDSSEDLDSPSPRAEARLPAGQDQENVAFMITESQIQALSGSEVQEIVSAKGEGVQTLSVSSHKEGMSPDVEFVPRDQNQGPIVSLDKKPIIIIFPEPMDICTAYKRLSTVFEECDEEFEAIMGESGYCRSLAIPGEQQGSALAPIEEAADGFGLTEPRADRSQSPETADVKRPDSNAPDRPCVPEKDSNPLKIRFPKQQLSALTKAIQCGTRTGQKTLQVVIYEEEEKMDRETGRLQTATVKKYEIQQLPKPPAITANTYPRTEDIKNKTYRRLDSLEETIRELESTLSEISQHPSTEYLFSKGFLAEPKPAESLEQLVDDPELFGSDRPPGAGGESQASAAADVQPLPSPTKKSPTSRTKPPLLPKPHIPPGNAKGGNMPSPITRTAIPPAPKLKPMHGSTDKMKMNKQREEYLNLQRQQQGSQQVVYF